jgi:hypothetical protein
MNRFVYLEEKYAAVLRIILPGNNSRHSLSKSSFSGGIDGTREVGRQSVRRNNGDEVLMFVCVFFIPFTKGKIV